MLNVSSYLLVILFVCSTFSWWLKPSNKCLNTHARTIMIHPFRCGPTNIVRFKIAILVIVTDIARLNCLLLSAVKALPIWRVATRNAKNSSIRRLLGTFPEHQNRGLKYMCRSPSTNHLSSKCLLAKVMRFTGTFVMFARMAADKTFFLFKVYCRRGTYVYDVLSHVVCGAIFTRQPNTHATRLV